MRSRHRLSPIPAFTNFICFTRGTTRTHNSDPRETHKYLYMKNNYKWFTGCSLAVALLLSSVGLSYAGGGKRAKGGRTPTEFSGRAVVVDATVLGVRTVVGDTGELPATGGAFETSLLELNQSGLTANVIHGSTIGQGDRSRTEASVASFSLTAGGHTITAGLLQSRAEAVCGANGPTTSASSELASLTIDGRTVTVGTAPNESIVLPDGTTIIINEQTSSSQGNYAATTVNALHVTVPNPLGGAPLADVIIASSHADIRCGTSTCQEETSLRAVDRSSHASRRAARLALPAASKTTASGAISPTLTMASI